MGSVSLNVKPVFAADYKANVGLVYAERSRDCELIDSASRHAANAPYVPFRKLGVTIARSAHRRFPSFSLAVAHVVGMGAEPEMMRINAARVVAGVENVKGRLLPSGKPVSDPVGDADLTPESDVTIPELASVPTPFPATRRGQFSARDKLSHGSERRAVRHDTTILRMD